jgi:hypothetical protein
VRLCVAPAQMVGKGLCLDSCDGTNPDEKKSYQTFHYCVMLGYALWVMRLVCSQSAGIPRLRSG